MSRYKAASIHLTLSALVVGTVFSIVFFVWYPGSTFFIAGAWSIVLVLIGVDLMVGPTLTCIVYREGKPGLKFDLAVIVTVQLSAMIYGAHTLYQERPAYLVFAVDRLSMVAARHIDESQIRYDELKDRQSGSVINVFARKPEDPEELARYMDSILAGERDLEERPEYWEPYEQGRDVILAAARPLSDLPADNKFDVQRIQKAIDTYQSSHPRLGFLPVASLKADIGMLIDMDTAEPIDVLRVNPWIEAADVKAPSDAAAGQLPDDPATVADVEAEG